MIWKDRKYINPRKRVFKNMDTNEILNLEIQDDPENIEEESETPLNAHNLNQSQQELLDDMSKTYTGTNITGPTVEGYGTIHKLYGNTIEEGTGEKSPTNPYTLRCVGDDVNLFDRNSHIELDGEFRYYATGETMSSSTVYGLKIPVKPSQGYTTTIDLEYTDCSNLCFFDKDMNFIGGNAYNTENKNFTTPSNCYYITLAMRKTATKFELKHGKSVIEIISKNGSSSNSNICYTAKPLCCLKDGDDIVAQDYIDYGKGVVHRECGSMVLNGTENWVIEVNYEGFYRFGLAGFTDTDTSKSLICSHFKQIQDWVNASNHILIGSVYNTDIWIMTNKATTLQDFKTWLSQNPITIIYQLTTPTTESINCSNKIVQYANETTVSNRDNAEIEVSLTNNKAISEVNEDIKSNEIQTITNENGTAIKFPNGMSICSFFGERATGSTYGDVIWNYPMPFKEAPVVLGLAGQGENYAVLQMMLNSPGTNMAVVQFLQNNSYYVSKKAKFSIVAIGRWK